MISSRIIGTTLIGFMRASSSTCRPQVCRRMFANVRSDEACSPTISGERGINCGLDLGDAERMPADLGQRLRIDQKLVAKHGLELTHVHFRHQDMSEALQ